MGLTRSGIKEIGGGETERSRRAHEAIRSAQVYNREQEKVKKQRRLNCTKRKAPSQGCACLYARTMWLYYIESPSQSLDPSVLLPPTSPFSSGTILTSSLTPKPSEQP